jgi:hypothetical protein
MNKISFLFFLNFVLIFNFFCSDLGYENKTNKLVPVFLNSKKTVSNGFRLTFFELSRGGVYLKKLPFCSIYSFCSNYERTGGINFENLLNFCVNYKISLSVEENNFYFLSISSRKIEFNKKKINEIVSGNYMPCDKREFVLSSIIFSIIKNPQFENKVICKINRFASFPKKSGYGYFLIGKLFNVLKKDFEGID